MDRHAFTAPEAPRAIGPYSHAVAAGGLLFCSGQLPLDPATRRCLENLAAVCSAAGAALASAVRITLYLTDLSAFEQVNEVYASYFGEAPPARIAVGVAALPRGAQVEIDATVALPG